MPKPPLIATPASLSLASTSRKYRLPPSTPLNNDVLPFFEEHRVPIYAIISDNGREFCGRRDKDPYELFLQLGDIQHKTTHVRRPQNNGFLERFHRTLLDECLRIQGCKTWLEDIHLVQTTIDFLPTGYNFHRPHQGRGMK